MPDQITQVTALARDLVALDSRSFVSNRTVADRVEAALPGFDIEHLDYTDGHGARHRLAGRPVVRAAR